jgi:hypothetical protein
LNYIRKHEAKAQREEIIGFGFPDATRNSIVETNLFDSNRLDTCKKVIALTSNPEGEIQAYKDELNRLNTETDFHYIEDTIEPIETYTDMMVYLPGKSMSELVNLMKGKA